jgi:hypothetical protein
MIPRRMRSEPDDVVASPVPVPEKSMLRFTAAAFATRTTRSSEKRVRRAAVKFTITPATEDDGQ